MKRFNISSKIGSVWQYYIVIIVYFRVFYLLPCWTDYPTVQRSPIQPRRQQLLEHKLHTSYMDHTMSLTMVLQRRNLSLIHHHSHHQLHWLQRLPRVVTVNPVGPHSLLTRPNLGTFHTPCLLAHLATCLITHLMEWAWQQIPREALHSVKMLHQNGHSHQLAQVCHLRMSCLITLIRHCLRGNSLQMDHRDTHLVWHQMLFLIHFWTMGILQRRHCPLKEIYCQTVQAMVPPVLQAISHRKAAQTMIAERQELE